MKQIDYADQQRDNKGDVIIVNGEIFSYKGIGNTRRVYANADKTKVVKIPVSLSYQNFNDEEIELYEAASDEKKKQLAHTTQVENGFIIQEYLHTLDDPTTVDWLKRPMTMKEIRFAESCRRDVGYDKDGNLKCFDIHEYKQY